MNTHTSSLRRHGFTLIELMIAVSLGMMIVYTATAAFRVASQAVTTANRLSLENSVLRSGYLLAHRDLDFWTNVDDPDNTDRQGLRLGAAAAGMPFTPFSTSWSTSIGDTEDAVGHDPRDESWAMGNPRVWWRGNMAEKNNSDLRFGRYSLFANRATKLNASQLGNISVITGKDKDGKDVLFDYSYGGPVTVPHSWAYAQISGLEKSLGFYGLCDYMPANAVYAYYVPWDGGCNAGGMPKWLIDPGGGFNNGDGGQQTPRGKYRNSYMTSYGIIPSSSTSVATGKALRDLHRRHWRLGYGAEGEFVDQAKTKTQMDEFNELSIVPEDYLPTRPQHWPGLTVSVQRLIKNARFVNVARVSWTNAITGEVAELSFSGFGTTLRGARQQRKDDVMGGWAKWDNDGSANDKTLDGN